MSSLLKRIFFAGLVFASADCGEVDFYSMVEEKCDYLVPNLGVFLPTKEERIRTTLTPECKEALESVLPYDDSFDKAPPGLKDKVTEAFQALLAYKLAIPKVNRLLGVAPASYAGAIPSRHIELFKAEGNPNRSIFNHVLNRIDVIKFAPERAGNSVAVGHYAFSAHPRELTILESIWGVGPDTRVYPFKIAGVLVHESAHLEGVYHSKCDESATGYSERLCDQDLTQSFGLEVAYFHFLLQGSSTALDADSLEDIGIRMVWILSNRINKRFAGLDEVIRNVEVSEDWIREREGI